MQANRQSKKTLPFYKVRNSLPTFDFEPKILDKSKKLAENFKKKINEYNLIN